eukprot:gene2067-2464_t
MALAWLEEDMFFNRDEAVQLINQAIKIDPKNVRIYIAKASMELRRGDISGARQTLESSCKLPSEDGQHYTMLGTLEMDYGTVAAAQRVLEEGAKRYPGDQYLLQRWGTLEAKHGNATRARDLFQRSVNIKPHAPTFVAWAMLEDALGLQVTYIIERHRVVGEIS